MTTATKSSTKLLCPECRRENEAERVYCHDCGTRLDRSAVRVKKEPIDDTRKRVERMFDPTRAKIRALFFATIKLIIGAGLTAVVVVIALPPTDAPALPKGPMLVSSLRFDLEGMTKRRQPAQKDFSEQEANAFIASVVRSKQASLDKPLLPFKRVILAFHEQRCAITTERSLAGYWSVYAGCVYLPELKDGRLSAKVEAGHLGRLPIHPKLAQFMGFLFADIRSALDQETKMVTRLSGFELHEKSVTLTAPLP